MLITLFGRRVTDEPAEGELRGPAEAQRAVAEDLRRRRWDAVPKELKAAIKRVHENLGHPPAGHAAEVDATRARDHTGALGSEVVPVPGVRARTAPA